MALRIKTNAVRGGIVENVFMRDVTIGEVKQAIVHVDFNYEEGDKGPTRRSFATSTSATSPAGRARWDCSCAATSAPRSSNVRLTNCTFENVAKGDLLEHVRDLALTNVTINGTTINQTINR